MEIIVPFIAVYFAFSLSNDYWLWCWYFNKPWIIVFLTHLERVLGASGNNETIVDTFQTFQNAL